MSAVTFVCGHLTTLSQICLDAIIQCAIALAGEDQEEWSPHASSSFSHFQPPVWLALSPSPFASPFKFLTSFTSPPLVCFLSLTSDNGSFHFLLSSVSLSTILYAFKACYSRDAASRTASAAGKLSSCCVTESRLERGESAVCARSCREEDCYPQTGISVLEQLEQHVLLLTNLPKLPLIAKLKFTLALFKRYC